MENNNELVLVWNNSTKVNKPIIERRTMENFVQDPSNKNFSFRDEESNLRKTCSSNLDKRPKRNQEIPFNLKLVDDKEWRFETTINYSELEVNNLEKTRKSLNSCKRFRSQLQLDNKNVKDLNKNNHSKTIKCERLEQTGRNRFAIEKLRSYQISKHSGVWEYNPFEKRYMWSDTGSFDPESPGDVRITRHPDAYILSGPTLSTSAYTIHRSQRTSN
jgi:hypothetical protein